MDLNKAMVIGRLTRDPEVRTTPNGATVCSFSIATNFNWTNQAGQKQEQVEYHNIVAWRKLAEIIGQYMKKGSRIYVEGRLATRSWEGTDGKKNYRTEIVADNIIMLDSKGSSAAGGTAAGGQNLSSIPNQTPLAEQPEPKADIPDIQIDDSDIPF